MAAAAPGTGEPAALLAAVAERTRLLADHLGAAEPGSSLPAVAVARDLARMVDQALRVTVDRARDAGHTWQEIGTVLGTTRQAAFQRFGRAVDPRTGVPMAEAMLPDAGDRAVDLLADLVSGRYERARRDFDEVVGGRLDAGRLSAVWAHVVGTVGGYRGMGGARVHQAGDYTVVNVPLYFEAGDMTGRVSYDRDGRVAGLYFLPLPDAGQRPTAS